LPKAFQLEKKNMELAEKVRFAKNMANMSKYLDRCEEEQDEEMDEISHRDIKEAMDWALLRREFLQTYDIPDSDWCLFGLWISLLIRLSKRDMFEDDDPPSFAWELMVYDKRDSELSPLEIDETLYLLCLRAVEWTDHLEFENRMRSIMPHLPNDDPHVADTWGALEVEISVSKLLRQNFVYDPEDPTEEFYDWLSERKREMVANSRKVAENVSIRPGEKETQIRKNMGTYISNARIVMEQSRSPRAKAFLQKDAFDEPTGTRARNAAVLKITDLYFAAQGVEWWSNTVLFAQDFHAMDRFIRPEEAVIVQNLGRFDVLLGDTLYETKDAETAVFNWCILSVKSEEFIKLLVRSWGVEVEDAEVEF
jgi:hypothetical protein